MVMLASNVWINAQAVRPTCSHVCEGYVERSSCWNRSYRRVSRQAASFRKRYRRNGRRLWREGSWLVDSLVGGGGARARPPVFPRTMPNGAFVKVSSFTADAGAAAAAARRAPPPGSDNRLRRNDRRSTEVVRLFHRPLPPPPLSPPRIRDNTH